MAKNTPARPPRYDDVVGSASPAAVRPAGGNNAPATTNAPAGVLRGGADVAAGGSFSVDAREDDPGDRDRRAARRPPVLDLISKRLGFDYQPSTGDRFDWCRDVYGHRMQFSRRYTAHDVLVDLFAADTTGVREEIARKRAALDAHNAIARAAVDALRESPANEASVDAGMAVLRKTGDVPFGYVPLVAFNAEVDVDGLRKGAVLDLPAREVALR